MFFVKIKKNSHIGKITPPIGGAANAIACISHKICMKQQKPKYYQGLLNHDTEMESWHLTARCALCQLGWKKGMGEKTGLVVQ